MMPQIQPGANYTIQLSLPRYLLIRGLGKQRNVSFQVNASTTVSQSNNPVLPDNGQPAMLVKSFQFSGVQSGLVAYTVTIDGNDISGYAINDEEEEIDLLNYGPLNYTIENTQTSPIVVNIDYISIPSSSLSIDILQALYGIQSGGKYALPGA